MNLISKIINKVTSKLFKTISDNKSVPSPYIIPGHGNIDIIKELSEDNSKDIEVLYEIKEYANTVEDRFDEFMLDKESDYKGKLNIGQDFEIRKILTYSTVKSASILYNVSESTIRRRQKDLIERATSLVIEVSEWLDISKDLAVVLISNRYSTPMIYCEIEKSIKICSN